MKWHGDSRVDEELAACKTLAKKQASISRSRTIRHVADELGASARHAVEGPAWHLLAAWDDGKGAARRDDDDATPGLVTHA